MRKIVNPALLGLVLGATLACQSSVRPEHAHAAPADASTLKQPGDAKVGETTKCLVSGEAFTVTEGSPKVEYKGKTYYFCCAGCDNKFKQNPAKYLGPK